MKASSVWKRNLALLRRPADKTTQAGALLTCSGLPLHSPVIAREYHDALLFTMAWPFTKSNQLLAAREMERLLNAVKNKTHNSRWQYALANTGIAFTSLQAQFSADMVQWLSVQFPEAVTVESLNATPEIMAVLTGALSRGIEFYETGVVKKAVEQRLRTISGQFQLKPALQWLIAAIDKQAWPPAMKDYWYDQLQVYVKWQLGDPAFSRSGLKTTAETFHDRKALTKKTDCKVVMAKPPSKRVAAPVQDWLHKARLSLTLYCRETDPLTYADPDECFLFDMGEGLQILLTGMKKERRLSIESYIGFTAFQQGWPVAYGGGWLFGYQCTIGVNVYPPYRGGDSYRLFAEVMRLYRQQYGAAAFIVKPYQFGYKNPEGIQSGAFWFYYKLGFRPADAALLQLAEDEWKKITDGNHYRSPVSVLKQFTAASLHGNFGNKNIAVLDADKLSSRITTFIGDAFNGNREEAARYCLKRLLRLSGRQNKQTTDPSQKTVMENWALLYAVLPGTGSWTRKHQTAFIEMAELKAAGTEKDFNRMLQRHTPFLAAAAIVAGG